MAEIEERPNLHVEFYDDKKLNKRKTAEAGRPIYDPVEKVKIMFPGDKHNIFHAPALSPGAMRDMNGQRLTYAEQFPEHYAAFKKGQEYIGPGTPLAELHFLNSAQCAELQAMNVHTAENLAALDGSNLENLGPGGRKMQQQAKAYLEDSAGSADVSRLAAENHELKKNMELMQKQLAELTADKKKSTQPSAEAVPNASDSTSSPTMSSEETGQPSPFDDWDDETISVWIVEQGGEKPHHKCNRQTLIAKADALNAKLAEQKAA
jgi:hypothetical protein